MRFEALFEAPGGIARVREIAVALALRGRLVPQDPADPPVASRVVAAPRHPIPASWSWARIGDTGRFVNGLCLGPKDRSLDGLPIIRIQNLTDPDRPLHRARGPFPPDRLVRRGDLLVAWSATLDAFVWSGDDAVLNQHIFKVTPDERLVSPRFHYHLLRHAMRGLARSPHAHGLVMKHVNRGPFLAWPVPIPPLPEQRRIADELDAILARCDALEARQRRRDRAGAALREANLDALVRADDDQAWGRVRDRWAVTAGDVEGLRQAIVALGVRGRLDTRDPGDEPASALLQRIGADAVEGPWPLPASWRWARLGDIARLELGRTPSTRDPSLWVETDGHAWLDIGDLALYGRVARSRRRISERAAREVFKRPPSPAGTLVMSFKLTIGKTSLLDVDAYHNEAIVSIHPADDAMTPYLLRALPLLAGAAHGTAAIKGRTLNRRTLAGLLVPVPPLAEQGRLAHTIGALHDLCDRLEERHAEARAAGEALGAAAAHHAAR